MKTKLTDVKVARHDALMSWLIDFKRQVSKRKSNDYLLNHVVTQMEAVLNGAGELPDTVLSTYRSTLVTWMNSVEVNDDIPVGSMRRRD